MLEDIAILTGATVISDEVGLSLENIKLEDLGQAKKIEVGKENTIIIDGAGKADAIKSRLGQIKAQIEYNDLSRYPCFRVYHFSSHGMIMENILEYHNHYSDDVISMGKGLKLQKCRDFVVA